MTENEAIKELENYVNPRKEAVQRAILALFDIQRYEETGLTPSQIKHLATEYPLKFAEVEAYKKIGTVEEVQRIYEKQRGQSVIIETEDDREYEDFICPNCKMTLQQRMKGANKIILSKFKYCHECGQKLDWGVMIYGKQTYVYNENSGQ